MNDITQQTGITEYSPVEAGLAELRSRLASVVYDTSTTAGMDKARTDRRECVKLRTSLENTRVALKSGLLERSRLVDGEAKRIREAVESLENPISDQIKKREEEQEAARQAKAKAEAERIAAIQARIDWIVAEPTEAIGKTADEIKDMFDRLMHVATSPEAFAEFVTRAQSAKAAAVAKLGAMHNAAMANEREAARLAEARAVFEREQAEARERDAKAAQERQEIADREHERQAEAARVAKTEVDALAAREKAVRDEEARQAKVAADQKAEKERQERGAAAADQRAKDDAARIVAKEKADREEADRLVKIKKKRAAEVAKARKIYDSPKAAFRGILTVVRDVTYSDIQARQEIGIIAEAHIPAEVQS